MEQTLNTAKRLLTGLNEIQPNISVHGLDKESEKIWEMKADLTKLVKSLNPDHPRVKRIIESQRKDVFSCLFSLRKQLVFDFGVPVGRGWLDNPPPRNHGSDTQLLLACLAAENFVKMCQKYLSSEVNLQKYTGSGATHKTSYEHGRMEVPDAS